MLKKFDVVELPRNLLSDGMISEVNNILHGTLNSKLFKHSFFVEFASDPEIKRFEPHNIGVSNKQIEHYNYTIVVKNYTLVYPNFHVKSKTDVVESASMVIGLSNIFLKFKTRSIIRYIPHIEGKYFCYDAFLEKLIATFSNAELLTNMNHEVYGPHIKNYFERLQKFGADYYNLDVMEQLKLRRVVT